MYTYRYIDLSLYIYILISIAVFYTNTHVYIDLIDIKPTSMEELTEVITCAEYHPNDSALCVYATSAGSIKVIDTRSKSSFDRQAATTIDSVAHSCRVYHHPTTLDIPSALQNSSSFSNNMGLSKSPLSSSFNRIAGATIMMKDASSSPPINTSNTSFFHEMISSISDIR